MKLTIIFTSDNSVGIPEMHFEIDVPFNKEDVNPELLDWFRDSIRKLYIPFTDTGIECIYDFEIKEREQQESILEYKIAEINNEINHQI